jgi:WD40 repeat protein
MKTLNADKIIQLTGHRSSVYCLADIPGSAYFLSAGGDGWIVLWNKSGKEENGTLVATVEGKIFSMVFDHSRNLLVAGDMDGHLYWIDLENKTILKRLIVHKGSVFSIKIWDNKIWTCGGDGYLCVLDPTVMMVQNSIRLSSQGLRCIEFVKDKIVVGGSDNQIRILDPLSLDTEKVMNNAHHNSIFTMWYDGESILYSGGRDAELKLWDISDWKEIKKMPAHWFTINKIIPAGDNNLITVSRDKSIRIWNRNDMTLLKSLSFDKGGHINSVNDAVYFGELNHFVTCGDDRSLILWKISG